MLKERRDLEERVKYLKKLVLEKTFEFEELSETRKATGLTLGFGCVETNFEIKLAEAGLDAQKSRINLFERRKLLLEKKQYELKVQLMHAKEMLTQQTTDKGTNVKDVKVVCIGLGIGFSTKTTLFRMS